MTVGARHEVRKVPGYCYNCVAGPDLLEVKVVDGVATEILPNYAAAGIHPGNGRICVRALGLIQKTYNPHRLRTPMKRTNPRKGRSEDPGFVPISWDEALDDIASRLREIRAGGLHDAAGLPRVAASFGHGGTPQSYMGTFPAFLSAWGPVDFSFGSGQGVKCVHSEHLYGEFWHRGFTVCADTPFSRYIVSFGANVEVSAGVCAVHRHAEARMRGIKRVQVEPHLSVTAAASAQWVPIKPKTDAAFMFAMLHVLLHEHPREYLDVVFLRDRTASPYLIGPKGYYLRDSLERKPLVWDSARMSAVPYDQAGATVSLEGRFTIKDCIEIGPDEAIWRHESAVGTTAFTRLVDHMQPFSPEWAAKICDVPAAIIRQVANEYLDNACVGETIEIDGKVLPFRPVAVVLGKTVNNGWGGFECCWGRTMLALLVGALEVPGGTLGTTTRLNKPIGNRLASVKPGEDGFMASNFNATDKERWTARPTGRNAHSTLVPLVGNSAWAQALGPTHLAWMFLQEAPQHWQQPSAPDLWFVFRSNPAISFWDSGQIVKTMAKMPFVVAFAYTFDETNHMADILLPDATDLESTQLIRIGGTKFVEQQWQHQGVALRQPAVAPRAEARDFTWISSELARRCGLVEPYNTAINRGTACVPLKGHDYDFSLEVSRVHSVEEIWDAECKAATAQFSNGAEVRDLAWFKEHGFFVVPFKRLDWYLYPTMVEKNLRFELPYQDHLFRAGQELANRLHEHDIHWWDAQLEEYAPLPVWDDVPARWERALQKMGADPADYPLWLITTKSMQYSAGNNAGIPLMNEVGQNMRGHGGVILNVETARRLGIRQDDLVEIRSVTHCTQGRAVLVQGIRPDTVVIIGQFDHWKTPYAKDLHFPSLNSVAPLSLDLTDSTGSGADLVRVSVQPVKERS